MLCIGKLTPLPQSRIFQILKANGFKETKSGKHITFKRTSTDGCILTTWVPHHREVSVFVIKHIIKQAEKPREEFE